MKKPDKEKCGLLVDAITYNCFCMYSFPFFNYHKNVFLAHLSTMCSGGAIVTGHRQASVRPSVRPLTISLKIFSSKTRRPILIKLGRNVTWMKLYKKLLKEFNSNKNSGCHGNKMAENGKNL